MDRPAFQTLLGDLVENILRYSDNPGACARHITAQIRELIGVRTVALISTGEGTGLSLVGVCPSRKEEYWSLPEIRSFIATVSEFVNPVLVDPLVDPAAKPLASLGIGISFVIPLLVGDRRVGLLVLLDLMDPAGAAVILDSLSKVSRILALILRNSFLYNNLEKTVEHKTEQLQNSLREKEVMLKEIHHRVKNNMQIISSLLSLQSKNIADKDIQTMFEESQRRIGSMALIHEKLYQSKDMCHIDFKDYLHRLVQGISSTFTRHDVRIVVDMKPVALDINTGIPCGLIVNELVSNCLKHAFPEGRNGTITLGIYQKGNGSLVLTVADDGIGFPAGLDFRKTASLGLQLINVLAAQIRGTIELSREGGTTFCITLPEPQTEGGI